MERPGQPPLISRRCPASAAQLPVDVETKEGDEDVDRLIGLDVGAQAVAERLNERAERQEGETP